MKKTRLLPLTCLSLISTLLLPARAFLARDAADPRTARGVSVPSAAYPSEQDSAAPLRWASPCTAAGPSDDEKDALIGVAELEEWLQREDDDRPRATIDPRVRHAVFGGPSGLRGLQWHGPAPPRRSTVVATVPAAKVLRSDYPQPAWDAELACRLWSEYAQGSNSRYAGYLHFLTAGQPCDANRCPSPLVPHAVRHWTPSQLDRLRGSSIGERVLELHRRQQQLWRQKYEDARFPADGGAAAASDMSWDQFAWAMEVVHSRAYLGASMESAAAAAAAIPAVAAPLAAAGGGLYYAATSPDPSPAVLGLLAAAAALPTIWKALAPSNASQQSAAMLPLIDSANHRTDADSAIRYDPLRQRFELVVGPGCVDPESQQLYVSYGPKSDEELLLNYGFLPGYPTTVGGSAAQDDVRRQLASTLCERNP